MQTATNCWNQTKPMKRAQHLATLIEDPPTPLPLAPPDLETGQNIDHSIAAQELMSHAHRYNRWLVETLRGAWEGSNRVLDVGCSIGNVTQVVADRLAQTGGAGTVVVGVEIIPAAAKRFAERFIARTDLRVLCADAADPPPALREMGPFDAAVSFNVFEHIQDDVGALRGVAGLLAPGGRLGLLVPGGGNRLYGTMDARDRHFRRYTAHQLAARLEAAGYDVVSIRRVNMFGALLWFLKGRVMRSDLASIGELSLFDRMVPVLRPLDRLCGPPFGQSLAAVARVRA
ncbi:MAG: class I SAM-dependent methyltransferase [Candidatus Dormibacteraeota bacterium]|nr:class I SAM-dependent methyltransferase [Candidatus Dormibacteraeota bacterium]